MNVIHWAGTDRLNRVNDFYWFDSCRANKFGMCATQFQNKRNFVISSNEKLYCSYQFALGYSFVLLLLIYIKKTSLIIIYTSNSNFILYCRKNFVEYWNSINFEFGKCRCSAAIWQNEIRKILENRMKIRMFKNLQR